MNITPRNTHADADSLLFLFIFTFCFNYYIFKIAVQYCTRLFPFSLSHHVLDVVFDVLLTIEVRGVFLIRPVRSLECYSRSYHVLSLLCLRRLAPFRLSKTHQLSYFY